MLGSVSTSVLNLLGTCFTRTASRQDVPSDSRLIRSRLSHFLCSARAGRAGRGHPDARARHCARGPGGEGGRGAQAREEGGRAHRGRHKGWSSTATGEVPHRRQVFLALTFPLLPNFRLWRRDAFSDCRVPLMLPSLAQCPMAFE